MNASEMRKISLKNQMKIEQVMKIIKNRANYGHSSETTDQFGDKITKVDWKRNRIFDLDRIKQEKIIPQITEPLGKYWRQPDRKYIELDDTHALMSEQTFLELADYSFSRPTGVYQGKMWRTKYNKDWVLHWYELDNKNSTMYIQMFRYILVV